MTDTLAAARARNDAQMQRARAARIAASAARTWKSPGPNRASGDRLMTAADRERISHMAGDGCTHAEISHAVGRSISAVRRALRRAAYQAKFDHDEAIRRYVAGESICDVAKSFGVSTGAVNYVLDRDGIARRRAA